MMNFIIKGQDVTEQIQHAEDTLEIMYLFECFKDTRPISDETEEHWLKRNNNLLAAMLLMLTKNQLRTQGHNEYGDKLKVEHVVKMERTLIEHLGVDRLPKTFHY